MIYRSITDCWSVFVFLVLLWVSPTAAYGQCTLICGANQNLSLPASGQFMVTAAQIAPTAATFCPGPLTISLTTASGLPLPNATVTCQQAGQTVTATLTHTASGNSCSVEISISDVLPPVLVCADRLITCQTDPTATPVALPEVLSDNCTVANIDYQDVTTDLPCNTIHNGVQVTEQIERTWTVTDQAGNSSTCLEMIYVRTPTLAQVTVPPNLDNVSSPALGCGANYEDLSLTGQPTLGGQPLDPSSSCDMAATYTDQIVPGCSPMSFTVLRTWLIVDFCNSNIRQHVQLVRVLDKVAPILTVPAPIVVACSDATCTATVTLPNASATDACSSVSIQANWAFGSGFGPFQNVPKGTYTVTYRATDACGNTATATTTLTVRDQTPPHIICSPTLQAGLGANGTVLINTNSADAGTWDNCGPVLLALSRDSLNWGPTAAFSCADLGAPVPVLLRASDTEGLTNFCVVSVQVRDFQKPVLNCPNSLIISCLQDPNNLALTGQAIATDNCSTPTVVHQDVTTLDGCRIGSVVRTWTATDAAANTRTCAQTITLTAVNTTTVAFPANVTLNACANAVNLDPTSTGRPVLGGQACFVPTVTHTDEVFTLAPPSCFMVIRRWRVVDHCINGSVGGSAGIWEQAQQIMVADQTPPVLTVPVSITVSPNLAGCTMAQVTLPDATATDCSTQLTFTNNSPFATNQQSANASGTYPLGTHVVTWRVEDGCGNFNVKTVTITVADNTPPMALCRHGLSVSLGAGGLTALTPAMFDAGSTDNCAPASALMLSITPTSVGCSQIGNQPVTLTVTDPTGLQSQCQTFVIVQDNNNTCNRYTISGTIRDVHNQALPGVTVRDGQGHTVLTDDSGVFTFNSLTGGQNYSIRPEHNGNWKNGVTTYDLLLISQHILGLVPLDTPAKIYAADANNSNTVTTFDIVQLRKIILTVMDTVPNSTSWRFYPTNYVFPNLENPFVSPVPATIELNALDASVTNLEFRGIKTGDLNLSADPNDMTAPMRPAELRREVEAWILRRIARGVSSER
jgi:hypothetical protein